MLPPNRLGRQMIILFLSAYLAMGVRICSAFIWSRPTFSCSQHQQQRGCNGGSRGERVVPRRHRRVPDPKVVMAAPGPGVHEVLLSAWTLLAEEAPKTPNIYGPIALGGLGIFGGSLISALLVGVVLRGMNEDEIKTVATSLSGGEELAKIEKENYEQREKLRALEVEMKQTKPSEPSPQGSQESGIRSDTSSEGTANSSGVVSLEDEYD